MHGLPVDTDAGPPLDIPLRFFLAGLGFLVVAAVVGVLDALDAMPGLARIAYAHLLLAGWACLTILGAMAQFVPTWSGSGLRWRRLVSLAFPFVTLGVAGLALGFALSATWLLPSGGALAALGFWLFVAALLRTLLAVRPWDATETHFVGALVALALVPVLGLLLALERSTGAVVDLGASDASVLGAHATLALFGVVVVSILGALRQLAVMFTQTEPSSADRRLLRLELATVPLGVLLLAVGRFVGDALIARVGGGLLCLGVLAFAVVLAHLLIGATVDYTPMHSRYGVVALALAGWVGMGGPVLLETPLSRAVLFGGPAARWLLFLGVVAFTILGTLYHVVPFLVWLDRYADRVGLEPVPDIDDLYVDRLATLDLALTTTGLLGLVASELHATPPLGLLGSVLFLGGVLVAVANLFGVVVRHRWFTETHGQPPTPAGE